MTDIRTPPLYVEDPRLQIALAALRVIARMTGYSPDKPGFRVVAQAALKEITSFEAEEASQIKLAGAAMAKMERLSPKKISE